ncbi:MAG: alkaline phosphatase [Myxococcales bacterium]|jgi:arylsulfatase A-like enzyme
MRDRSKLWLLVGAGVMLATQLGLLRWPSTGDAAIASAPATVLAPPQLPKPPEGSQERDARDAEAVVAELAGEEIPPPHPRRQKATADLVVLVSVDGLRPDVIFPHARNIERMRQQGTFATNARTISKATTLPSHASMVSGVDHPRHGLSFNSYRPERGHIRYPTIFSVAQEAGLTTALFVGKRKLAHLLDPEHETHFEVGGAFCDRVSRLAVPYLRTAEPGVVFVHFSDPDGAGHLYGWMSHKYERAVRRADRCVGELLEALQERGDLERTLVLVTSDHGGHDHRHGSRHWEDRHIPWILWGGAAEDAVKVRRRVYNTDTAATILRALGLQMPEDIEGAPVFEGLAGVARASETG